MIALGLSLRLSALAVTALALADPSEAYDRGRTAFLRAEYQRAITTLEPLLYPELRLESEDEVVQAHRILGVSYLFENQPDHARSEFRKLLELAPDFRFDPLLDPPRVVDFFNQVVREQQDELGDIESRLKKREAELARRSSQVLERRIERRSFLINFVPFGAGQFQNQQRRKAWVFFATEAALAATSIAAFVTNFSLYGVRPIRPCLDPPTTNPSGTPWVCPSRPDRPFGRELLSNPDAGADGQWNPVLRGRHLGRRRCDSQLPERGSDRRNPGRPPAARTGVLDAFAWATLAGWCRSAARAALDAPLANAPRPRRPLDIDLLIGDPTSHGDVADAGSRKRGEGLSHLQEDHVARPFRRG